MSTYNSHRYKRISQLNVVASDYTGMELPLKKPKLLYLQFRLLMVIELINYIDWFSIEASFTSISYSASEISW